MLKNYFNDKALLTRNPLKRGKYGEEDIAGEEIEIDCQIFTRSFVGKNSYGLELRAKDVVYTEFSVEAGDLINGHKVESVKALVLIGGVEIGRECTLCQG